MRVLVLGPRFADGFADNVAETLVEMGHEVLGAEEVDHAAYWSVPRRALRMVEERVFGDAPLPQDRKLLRLVKDRRPDVLLALTWDVHPEVLDALGRFVPGRRILWWGDAPANSRRFGLVNPFWDKVYVKDPDAVKKLRLAGKECALLHEAMNPRWHRPLAKQTSDAVVVAGNYYAFRQAVLMRLLRDGARLELYGAEPPPWSAKEIRASFSGKYVVREEKSRVFGAGMACLNTFALAEGNSLNCRAFEIAGAGGLQLVEFRPTLLQCFEPGKEVLTFETYEELRGHLEHARHFPADMLAIREAGARRALAEHTYRHRLETILADFA
ncbi:MAG TPA: glycosyltransferase [Polyangium sp.]|nr:glycosyltransferase [Polyangium sp.]